MIKHLNKFLASTLAVALFFNETSCAMKQKNLQVTTIPTQDPQPLPQAPLQEELVIQEIRSLLEDGKVPDLTFNEWVDAYVNTLLQSNKEALVQLGQTLQTIRQGNVVSMNGFKILPQFEKAVQAYDPKFYIGIFSKPGIIAKGTYWYFSSPKKK